MTPPGPRRDVELVEDGEPRSTDVPAPPRVPTRRRVRRVGLGAAAVATVVAVAAVGQTVVDRREEARLAAVAELPTVAAALSGRPGVLWDVPDDAVLETQVRTPDGLLVGVRAETGKSVQAVAFDAGTGSLVWERDLVDAAARQPQDEMVRRTVPGSCALDPGSPGRVVCLAGDDMWALDEGALRRVPPTTLRLVVLDTDDGSVVADLTDSLAGPGRTSLAVVGDVVVVGRVSGDRVDVRALTTDGVVRWQTVLPGPVDEDVSDVVAPLEDLVAVTTSSAVVLLDATGGTVREVPRPDGRSVLRQAPGTPADTSFTQLEQLLGARWSAPGPNPPRTVVVGADEDVEVLGEVMVLSVDDGSVPGLVITSVGPVLHGWDGDGDELWSVELPAGWGALLLDGRLHMDGGTRLVTLDARTGVELWRTAATVEAPVTDGRLLLGNAATPSRGVQTELVALDPRDGSEVWRTPLPDDARLVVHHQLLLARWYEIPTDAFDEWTDHVTALG